MFGVGILLQPKYHVNLHCVTNVKQLCCVPISFVCHLHVEIILNFSDYIYCLSEKAIDITKLCMREPYPMAQALLKACSDFHG